MDETRTQEGAAGGLVVTMTEEQRARLGELHGQLNTLAKETEMTKLRIQVHLLEVAREAGIRGAFEVDMGSGTIREVPGEPGDREE